MLTHTIDTTRSHQAKYIQGRFTVGHSPAQWLSTSTCTCLFVYNDICRTHTGLFFFFFFFLETFSTSSFLVFPRCHQSLKMQDKRKCSLSSLFLSINSHLSCLRFFSHACTRKFSIFNYFPLPILLPYNLAQYYWLYDFSSSSLLLVPLLFPYYCYHGFY